MITYSIPRGHWSLIAVRLLRDPFPFPIKKPEDIDLIRSWQEPTMDLEFDEEEHLTYFLLRYADLFGDLK